MRKVDATWDSQNRHCVTARTEGDIAVLIVSLTVDIVLLALMLAGLWHRKEAGKFNLWRILWNQVGFKIHSGYCNPKPVFADLVRIGNTLAYVGHNR